MKRRKSYYRDSLVGLEFKIEELNTEEERRVRKQYDDILANLSRSADMLRQKKGKENIDVKAYRRCLQESDYKALFSKVKKQMHKTFNVVFEDFLEIKVNNRVNKSFVKESLALEALEGLINKDLMTKDSNLRLLFCNQLYKEKQNFLEKIFYQETTDFGKMQPLINTLINAVFTKIIGYVENVMKEAKLVQNQKLKF